MTDRDNYQKVGVEVDEASFSQLNQRANDAASSLHQLTQVNQAIADSANQAGSRLQSAFQSVKSNIDKDVASLKDLRNELNGAADDVQEVSQKSGGGFGVEGLRRTGGALNQLLPDSDIGPAIQRLGDVGQVVKEAGVAAEAANISIDATTVAIGGLEVATGPLIVVVGAAAAIIAAITIAQKDYNDQLKAGQELLNAALDAQTEYYTDVNKLTKQQAQQRIEDLKTDQRIQQQIANENKSAIIRQYDALAASIGGKFQSDTQAMTAEQKLKNARDQVGGDEGYKQLFAALDKANQSAGKFDQSITRVQQGLDAGAFKVDKLTSALGKAGELADTGAKAEAESFKKLNSEVQEAQKAAQERAQKQVDIVKKLDDQITSIEESAAQSRLQSAQKLQDALIKAAQNAVDAADKALAQLEQKRDENLLSLNRDLDKIDRDGTAKRIEDEITEQRRERDNLQVHLEALQQIKNRDASRERDDLLNRNYRDLFSIKEQQNTDIQTENRKYIQRQDQERQALSDQLNDEKKAQTQQRAERIDAYKQANTDALRQYNIELGNARIAKDKAIDLAKQANRAEINDLNNATNQKIKIAQAGAKADIQIVNQTEQEKFKIFQNYLNRARELEGQSTAPAFNSPQAISRDTGYAEGGIDPAFMPIKVNDKYGGKQRESVNGMLLPRGLGMFIPMTNASINSNAGGSSTPQVYNNTFNITTHDPAGVRQEVIGVMREVRGGRRF